MIEDVAKIFAAALNVDRNPDDACLGNGKQQRQGEPAVAQHQGYDVAGYKPDTAHPQCQNVRHPVEVAETDRYAFISCEQTGRIRLHAASEQWRESLVGV